MTCYLTMPISKNISTLKCQFIVVGAEEKVELDVARGVGWRRLPLPTGHAVEAWTTRDSTLSRYTTTRS